MSYIEIVKLLCRLMDHAYAARTPAAHEYWTQHNRKLRKLAAAKGWKL